MVFISILAISSYYFWGSGSAAEDCSAYLIIFPPGEVFSMVVLRSFLASCFSNLIIMDLKFEFILFQFMAFCDF